MERVIITLVAPAAGILPVWSSFAVTFSGVQEDIHGSPGDALKCQSVIAEIKIQSLDFRRAVGQIMLSEKGFELIFC